MKVVLVPIPAFDLRELRFPGLGNVLNAVTIRDGPLDPLWPEGRRDASYPPPPVEPSKDSRGNSNRVQKG